MKKFIMLVLLLIQSAYFLCAQQTSNLPVIGSLAPNIHFATFDIHKKTLKSDSLSSFGGRLVILEFWATWCMPCLPAMEHLNKLEKQFKDKLTIISLTEEDTSIVNKFLKNKSLELIVGIDRDSSAFNRFDPQTIPHSVLINKDGYIIAITSPEEITGRKIQKIIDCEPPVFLEKTRLEENSKSNQTQQVKTNESNLNDIVFSVKIRKSYNNERTYSQFYPGEKYNYERMIASALSIFTLYEIGYQTPYNRIVLDMDNPQIYIGKNADKYYMDLIVDKRESKNFYKIWQECLNYAFHWKATWERRNKTVKILKSIHPDYLHPSQQDSTSFSFRGPEINAKKISIKKLCEYLENYSKCPVVDETSLKKKYDFNFQWRFSDPNSLNESLNKFGLKLIDGKRKVRLLVLSKNKYRDLVK